MRARVQVMSNRKEPYVLGLDLDNTVADYTGGLRTHMMSNYGFSEAELPEPTNYNFVKAGWPFKDIGEYLDRHLEAVHNGMFRELDPLPGAIEAARALSDEGVHIHVVTHRLLRNKTYQVVVADTVAWLDYVGLPYHSLGFTGRKELVHADSYAEDAPANIETIRDAGMKVFTYDRTYNRDIDGERIHSWLDDGVTQILEHKASLGL